MNYRLLLYAVCLPEKVHNIDRVKSVHFSIRNKMDHIYVSGLEYVYRNIGRQKVQRYFNLLFGVSASIDFVYFRIKSCPVFYIISPDTCKAHPAHCYVLGIRIWTKNLACHMP